VVSALKKSLMDGESEDRGLIEAGVSTLTILSLSIDFALEVTKHLLLYYTLSLFEETDLCLK
jgi:hypothetical protein